MDDAAVDGSLLRALRGAHTEPSPVDRARPGSKHHLVTDRKRDTLEVASTGGNRHDVTQSMPLLDAIPRICGTDGRPPVTGRGACSPTGATTTTSAATSGPAASH